MFSGGGGGGSLISIVMTSSTTSSIVVVLVVLPRGNGTNASKMNNDIPPQLPTEGGYSGIRNFVRLLYGNGCNYIIQVVIVRLIACHNLSMNHYNYK